MYLNIYSVGTVTTQRAILIAIKFNKMYLSHGVCPKIVKEELQKLYYVVSNNHVGGSVCVVTLRLLCGIKILQDRTSE